jgi:hypothetical protein
MAMESNLLSPRTAPTEPAPVADAPEPASMAACLLGRGLAALGGDVAQDYSLSRTRPEAELARWLEAGPTGQRRAGFLMGGETLTDRQEGRPPFPNAPRTVSSTTRR